MASKILRKAGLANKGKKYAKNPYEKGKQAYKGNMDPNIHAFYLNPFFEGSQDYNNWDKGYNDAYFNDLSPEQLKRYNKFRS